MSLFGGGSSKPDPIMINWTRHSKTGRAWEDQLHNMYDRALSGQGLLTRRMLSIQDQWQSQSNQQAQKIAEADFKGIASRAINPQDTAVANSLLRQTQMESLRTANDQAVARRAMLAQDQGSAMTSALQHVGEANRMAVGIMGSYNDYAAIMNSMPSAASGMLSGLGSALGWSAAAMKYAKVNTPGTTPQRDIWNTSPTNSVIT